MIVQACLNGARPAGFHPALPVTPEDLARAGAEAVAAGAAELHVHPRDADGRESLAAVDDAVRALRVACPGTALGVSTGAWIEGDEGRTLRAVRAWREAPDYASVNLSEPAAPAVMEALAARGVGVEAGLAAPADAERLAALPGAGRAWRILIEIDGRDAEEARAAADAVAAVLARAGLRRPILVHGFGASVWPLVALAAARRWSTRVGLEDGDRLPDGTRARDNAALVAAAVDALRPGAGGR